ncbi:MAG: M4 family metallopeptidase [Acidobacteriota bacterium]|nr:M4 family metallopeptidase [Acidobacteriota bacterium]
MKWRVLALLTAVGVLAGVHPSAQTPPAPAVAQSMAVATTRQSLGTWDARVDTMLSNGQLDLSRIQRDTVLPSREHERLNQTYRGLPVFGGQIVRQVANGTVVSVFGRYFTGIDIGTQPAITAAAASKAAVAAQGANAVASGDPVLGVLPMAGSRYVLAWQVEVRSPWDIEQYYVDAKSGTVVRHISKVVADTASPAIGIGTGVTGDREKMSVNQAAGVYQAIDVLRPAAAFTLTFAGSVTRFNDFLSSGQVFNADIATSSTNTWTDGAVVDAHAFQGMVYDFYYKVLGRKGLDDANHQVTGIVHPLARADASRFSSTVVGTYINNALYLGNGYMLYGDGDGVSYNYMSGGLDVVGHELTHGVTDYTSQLVEQDESGALNEAFSDIMGTAIEFEAQPSTADWLIGEKVTLTSPGYIRSLQDPAANGYPDHYSLEKYIGTDYDNGGVHYNSTIVSHAFYLAVHGGTDRVSGITVQGVGMAKLDEMAKIFYRAWAFMLTSNAQFIDARNATLQAASDLYGAGSNEYTQVQQAWNAVGVQ